MPVTPPPSFGEGCVEIGAIGRRKSVLAVGIRGVFRSAVRLRHQLALAPPQPVPNKWQRTRPEPDRRPLETRQDRNGPPLHRGDSLCQGVGNVLHRSRGRRGRDADVLSVQETYTSPNADLEKGVRSDASSTTTDDRTLGGEAPNQEAERDPNIVDWDGPDDPENPLNWPEKKKWSLIACLGAITLVTYVPSRPHLRTIL